MYKDRILNWLESEFDSDRHSESVKKSLKELIQYRNSQLEKWSKERVISDDKRVHLSVDETKYLVSFLNNRFNQMDCVNNYKEKYFVDKLRIRLKRYLKDMCS